MSGLLAWAVSSVAIAILLGCAAALTARRRPAFAHALYVLALLKLITPALLSLAVWTPSPEFFDYTSRLSDMPIRNLLLPVSPQQSQSVPPALPVGAPATIGHLVLWVWGLGSVVVFVCALVRLRRFAAWVGSLRPASSIVQDETKRLAHRLGLRRAPAVLVTKAAVPPILCPSPWGLRIVVPVQLLAELSTTSRQTILVHELAHVLRRDWLIRIVELAVLIVWWWMPIGYRIRRGLRRVEESCCDAWVVSVLEDSTASYAEALVTTADFIHRTPRHVCGLGAVDQLEERMRMLQAEEYARQRRSAGWAGRAAILGLALVTLPVTGCGVPISPAADSVLAASDAGLHAQLIGAVERPVRIEISVDKTPTVLEVIARAELMPSADLEHVALIRHEAGRAEPLVLNIDVRAMIETGNTTMNVWLQAGDILYLPQRGEAYSANVRKLASSPPILADKSTIGQGDIVTCVIDGAVLAMPGAERLQLLARPQRVGLDGTILCPFVGPVEVVGKKAGEVEKVLNASLEKLFQTDLRIQVWVSDGH